MTGVWFDTCLRLKDTLETMLDIFGNRKISIARELTKTHEEINLKNTDLEILGELPFFYTGTGYKVKPIISKLNNNVLLEETLKPDLNEIEKIFIEGNSEALVESNFEFQTKNSFRDMLAGQKVSLKMIVPKT